MLWTGDWISIPTTNMSLHHWRGGGFKEVSDWRASERRLTICSVKICRSPGAPWVMQERASHHRQKAETVSSVDRFLSVRSPFQWGCRWLWPVLLPPLWCSCWVSSHRHGACKTQACAQTVRGGGKLQILSRKAEKRTWSQSLCRSVNFVSEDGDEMFVDLLFRGEDKSG